MPVTRTFHLHLFHAYKLIKYIYFSPSLVLYFSFESCQTLQGLPDDIDLLPSGKHFDIVHGVSNTNKNSTLTYKL